MSMAKTGATALALLTELFYFESTRDSQFGGLRRSWLRALQAMHLKGLGFMKVPGSSEDSSYYNGEVWLSLSHFARLFGADGKAREILEDVNASFIERYTEDPHIGFFTGAQWPPSSDSKRPERKGFSTLSTDKPRLSSTIFGQP